MNVVGFGYTKTTLVNSKEGVVIYHTYKRILDVIFAGMLLVVLSPLFIGIACYIRWDSKDPILFRQVRIGRNSQPFVIYKFRTMLTETPPSTATARLRHAHRYITPTGRFLRQTSLDELPQLFNVLKGDMSFVGPRPVIPEERYLLRLRRRYGADRVRPGITGLAQIRGRDELAPLPKARYDALYADTCSFSLDLMILRTTVGYVWRREGVRDGTL